MNIDALIVTGGRSKNFILIILKSSSASTVKFVKSLIVHIITLKQIGSIHYLVGLNIFPKHEQFLSQLIFMSQSSAMLALFISKLPSLR